MSQDQDIARVAAALRAPGLKYRSFGNDPVRPENQPVAKGTVTLPVLNAEIGRDIAGPAAAEDPRLTMKLIAETLASSVPPTSGPFPAPAPAAWPLLDSLTQPPAMDEAPEAARGTLVQLFGDLAAPMPGLLPAVLPVAAAPAHPAAAGPFPSGWAPQAAAFGGPAEPPGLLPADRVTAPLAEVLQNLGRTGAAPNPAFAALRLPGSGGVR